MFNAVEEATHIIEETLKRLDGVFNNMNTPIRIRVNSTEEEPKATIKPSIANNLTIYIKPMVNHFESEYPEFNMGAGISFVYMALTAMVMADMSPNQVATIKYQHEKDYDIVLKDIENAEVYKLMYFNFDKIKDLLNADEKTLQDIKDRSGLRYLAYGDKPIKFSHVQHLEYIVYQISNLICLNLLDDDSGLAVMEPAQDQAKRVMETITSIALDEEDETAIRFNINGHLLTLIDGDYLVSISSLNAFINNNFYDIYRDRNVTYTVFTDYDSNDGKEYYDICINNVREDQ